MGKPAASPEVQPSVRRAFVFKSNFAPLAACQFVPANCVNHVSQINPLPGSTMMAWRSLPLLLVCHCASVWLPVCVGQPSIGRFVGIGYNPFVEVPPSRSDSSG